MQVNKSKERLFSWNETFNKITSGLSTFQDSLLECVTGPVNAIKMTLSLSYLDESFFWCTTLWKLPLNRKFWFLLFYLLQKRFYIHSPLIHHNLLWIVFDVPFLLPSTDRLRVLDSPIDTSLLLPSLAADQL